MKENIICIKIRTTRKSGSRRRCFNDACLFHSYRETNIIRFVETRAISKWSRSLEGKQDVKEKEKEIKLESRKSFVRRGMSRVDLKPQSLCDNSCEFPWDFLKLKFPWDFFISVFFPHAKSSLSYRRNKSYTNHISTTTQIWSDSFVKFSAKVVVTFCESVIVPCVFSRHYNLHLTHTHDATSTGTFAQTYRSRTTRHS